MKQYITPSDIANTARMMRSAYKGSIIIVEGDTDARIYKRFIKSGKCELIVAHGKDNALLSIKSLSRDSFKGAIAVVDSDFWKLDEFVPDNPNIFSTDGHDLETMILSSEALDSVLTEFGSEEKMRKLGTPVKDIIFNAGLPVGFFRWMSTPKKLNLALNFKDLSFSYFVDTQNKALTINIENLVKHVKHRSVNNTFPDAPVIKEISKLVNTGGFDKTQVCCGHDLVHILSIGLRDVFGNSKAKKITYDIIDGILRIAYSLSFFMKTQLYRSIKDWEINNPGFEVFE